MSNNNQYRQITIPTDGFTLLLLEMTFDFDAVFVSSAKKEIIFLCKCHEDQYPASSGVTKFEKKPMTAPWLDKYACIGRLSSFNKKGIDIRLENLKNLIDTSGHAFNEARTVVFEKAN